MFSIQHFRGLLDDQGFTRFTVEASVVADLFKIKILYKHGVGLNAVISCDARSTSGRNVLKSQVAVAQYCVKAIDENVFILHHTMGFKRFVAFKKL